MVMICAVYGCMNTGASKPELSFFKFPADKERRSKWLRIISREDLMDKPPRSYTVCEEHFDALDILPGTHRKKLKTNSLPSRHLPEFQKKDVQTTTTDAPTLLETYTQTEEYMTLAASASTQTSRFTPLDTPLEIKLEPYLKEASKKNKLHEIENETGKCKKDIFHKLCNRFLTKELAELVIAQTHLKFNYPGNRYSQSYKMFCLNLYYTSPQAYRVLRSALCLPTRKSLCKHGIPVTSEINEGLMSILKIKVDTMTDMEKNCSVVIGTMSLKANLFYNLKHDRIIGFHEINGVQSPEPAKKALVVMVRGIFTDWKQPVGFALLSESRNYDEIAKWIDKLLEKLFEIGLNVRLFVSDMGSDLFDAAKMRSVTIERPYFVVNEKKVYYIFDAPHLIKLVRNNLISYDFHFQDRVAKYEHIVQFYENDKQKSFKLARKLTNNHIYPTKFEKIKVRYATQLLSNSVAAGISTYVDLNIIQDSGRDTAELVKIMNNLFDALNSSNLKDTEYGRAFRGEQSQTTFFNEMLNFFQHLKLIDPKNGKDVTSTVKFIHGFQVTITSIMKLFEDLKSEGCAFLLTRRLNQDVLEIFFGLIRTKNGLVTEPTSRNFISAFQKKFFCDIIKPSKAGNCEDDLGKLLIQISPLSQRDEDTIKNEEIEVSAINDKELYNNVKVPSSDYNQLDIPEKNSLFDVCGYLLKKCAERHNDCQNLKSYVKPNEAALNFSSESQYTRYREYTKDTNRSLLVIPPDNFVQYVEKMDDIFRRCFRREHINCKVAVLIYKKIEKICFIVPCSCFPLVYLRKLFIRMRIFYTIKFNNRAFRTCRSRRKYFSVTNI